MDQEQTETVELKAGTVLHYRGMPLELRADTVVNMRHANKALADEGDQLARTGAEFVFVDSDRWVPLCPAAQQVGEELQAARFIEDSSAEVAVLRHPLGLRIDSIAQTQAGAQSQSQAKV